MSSSKSKKGKYLKTTPTVKSVRYDICCEYCQCRCFSENSNYHDKNNNSKKKKRKPKRSMKSARDCVILKDISVGLPELSGAPKEGWPSTSVGELCESMQNLCLSPRVFEAYNKIPVHDQKILNRMARSRTKKAILTENSWLAQKFWENEKYERELAKCEQEEEYKKLIRQKQIRDSYITQARLQSISKRQKEELRKLQDNLYIRDLRLQDRLKKIKLQRKILKCEKSEDELRKTESVLQMLEKQQLHDELIKQDIYDSLKCRLSRAEFIRQKYLDTYARRLKHDNYMEQVLHEENYREAQKFEQFKNEELKQKIKQKDFRTKKFVDRRCKNYRDTVERARISASLRDLVRRSVSPDGLQFGTARQLYERPSSILSFQSCIKLG